MLSTRLFLSIASVAVFRVRGFATRSSLLAFSTRATANSARPFIPSSRQSLVMAASVPPSEGNALFLFDFDGVVCDSCDECTVSALRTCRKLGVLDESAPEYPPQWLFDKMREIRPAIEIGWQIPVLLSVFLNQQRKASEPNGPPAMTILEIIANYEELVANCLETWGKTEQDMVDTFGGIRDEWIQEDFNSWLDINTFYSGVPDALSNCKGEGILVTTKQQRFAIALCRHAGVGTGALPDDCIYGLGQYKKKEDVIVDRIKAGKYAPQDTYFFEDRWPTLVKCLKDERLAGVRLHLCSWGYVTEGELELARAEPRVEVLGLDDFARIVKL
jgi:phosphoglycolate phosphatase-like HAD superfamily hydrolase